MASSYATQASICAKAANARTTDWASPSGRALCRRQVLPPEPRSASVHAANYEGSAISPAPRLHGLLPVTAG